MKIVKKLVKFVLWLVGIAVVLVLTMPLWIGPVARTAANAIVPKKTGTNFNLGAFSLNPYSGRLTIGDIQLANPAGFTQKIAATLGQLHVDVGMDSVLGDTIIVEDVVVKDVFVSYVSNAKGEKNFDIIARNAKGEDESKVKGDKKVKVEGGGGQRSGKPSTSQTSKKVIIEHLLIEKVVVQLGPVSVPLPRLELRDIGRKSGGVTVQEAWDQVSVQVMNSLNSVGAFANELGKMGLGTGKRVDVKGMADAIRSGVEIFGDGTDKTTDAVNRKTEKAINAIKGLFK